MSAIGVSPPTASNGLVEASRELSKQNQFKAAITKAEEAVALAPDFGEAYERLGWLFSGSSINTVKAILT